MNSDAAIFRMRLIGVAVVSLMAALVARLWFLQAVDHQELQARAIDNAIVEVFETGTRGRILDVNGKELVRNRMVNVVVVDLEVLDRVKPGDAERLTMLERLANTLSRAGKLTKVADLQEALSASGLRNYGRAVVSFDVPLDLFVYFGEQQHDFPGVQIEQRSIREYPYGTLAAHVLGYVGPVLTDEINTLNKRYRAGDPDSKTYLQTDVIGRNGVERMFEDDLRGITGRRVYVVDKHQRVLREVESERRYPQPGHDVFLSIDIDIQALVEAELRTGLDIARTAEPEPKKNPTDPDPPPSRAPAGAAVVLNPINGAIVAMASYPTYDPTDFIGGISQQKLNQLNSDAAFKPLFNRALQGRYPPGSTFKLFTAYAAMTDGPNEFPMLSDRGLYGHFFPREDPGYYDLPEEQCLEKAFEELLLQNQGKAVSRDLKEEARYTSCRFRNADNRRHVNVDIVKALAVSSDSYFYEIAANYEFRPEFSKETIQEAASKFGFGRATGTGLPFEEAGVVPTEEWLKAEAESCKACGLRNYWVTADGVQLSVGQGLNLATPLQLVNGYATFANGGTLLAPNIARCVKTHDDTEIKFFDKRPVGSVDLPAEVRDPILWGLEGAITFTDNTGDKGTAYDAFHSERDGGVKFDLNSWKIAGKTGTAEVQGRADNAWFVAFNQDPERPYVVGVLLEESGFGGKFAAPAAAHIFDRLLNGYPEQRPADILTEAEKARLAPPPAIDSPYGKVSAFKAGAHSTATTTTAASPTGPPASAAGTANGPTGLVAAAVGPTPSGPPASAEPAPADAPPRPRCSA